MSIRLDQSLVKQILSRDGLTSDSTIADRRLELLRRLERTERGENVVKLAALGFAGVTLLQLGLFFADHILDLVTGSSQGFLPGDAEQPISLSTMLCGAIAMPLLLLYFIQQRSAKQIEAEARDLALLELQVAIAGLRSRLAANRTAKASTKSEQDRHAS